MGDFGLPRLFGTLPPMPINTTIFKVVSAAFCALLVMVSCGGSDVSPPASTSVEVSLTEFAYVEATWTVNAGEEFTLTLNNDGTVIHNWAIVQPGLEISREGDLPADPTERAALYLFADEVEAGASKDRQLIAPPAGTYQVICDIQAHFSAGMEGTLIVEG